MTRKLSGLTVRQQAQRVKGAIEGIPVPKGMTDPVEVEIWKTYSSARLPEAWLAHELDYLRLAVENLAIARKMRKAKKIDMIALMKLEKHIGAQLRHLKLTTNAVHQALRNAAKEARKAQHTIAPLASDDENNELLGLGNNDIN